MTVFLQVMTLFLLMLSGLAAAKTKLMNDQNLRGLNTLVLYFAQPALILHRLQTPASPELILEIIWVFVLACATMGLSGIVAFRLFAKEEQQRRSVLVSLSMLSNCGFMGFPIIVAALGDSALIYAVVFLAALNLMAWTLTAYYFGGPKAMQPKKLLFNPTMWAIAGGFLLFFTGWTLPGFANDALNTLGNTTTLLTMFVIGARLITLRKEHLLDTRLLLMCALRLVVFPAAILLLRFTPLSDMAVSGAYLCTAMPCAAMTAMQAELYDSDKELASRGVALSTALSIVTIPLMLLLV